MVWLVSLLFSRIQLFTGDFRAGESSGFSNKSLTSVFLGQSRFPQGASLTLADEKTDLSELSAIQASGDHFEISVPSGESPYYRWQIPTDFCPAPSYLIHAECELIANIKLKATGPTCFFVDPRKSGHIMSMTVQGRRPFAKIEYFVANSNNSDYECMSWIANESLNCFIPYAKPFFARLVGIEGEEVQLNVEYSSIRESGASTENGCDVIQIPAKGLDVREVGFVIEKTCVSRAMREVFIIARCLAVLFVLVTIGFTGHFMGYCDFKNWFNVSTEVKMKSLRDVCTVAAFKDTHEGQFSLALSDSFSSDLSEAVHI